MTVIAYSGWIGHNNIGDEALYLATQKLFPSVELVNIKRISNYDHLIFGGGTVLPHYTSKKDIKSADGFNMAIGVGARDPYFWNRKFGALDFGYYIGKMGYGKSLENNYIRYLCKPMDKFTSSVRMSNHYIREDDFENIREFDFNYLGVRGPRTHQILSKHNIEHEIVGDTALILEPSSYQMNTQNRIAVTLRQGTYQWSRDGNYIDTIIEFCQENSDTYEFVFLPFSPSDIELNRRAASAIPNAEFRDYCSYVDVEATIDELSNCDVVIADKLHANVLSACSYTPFISLEYRPKNLDFAESVQMSDFNIRSDELTKDDLEQRVQHALSSDDVVNKLKDEVEEKRSLLDSFATKVSKDI